MTTFEEQRVRDDAERVAVAMVDKGHARLFTIAGGRIETAISIADRIAPKHRGGSWHLLEQTRMQRRHDETVARHARRVAWALVDLRRACPFERLLLAGTPEALAALRSALPRALRDRVEDVLPLEMFASDDEVRRAALARSACVERSDDELDVGALLDDASADRAALGLRATLAALNDGRVHRLFVADTFGFVGGECRACRALVVGPGPCPTCGGDVAPSISFRDDLVARAVDQGAVVEPVAGQAAALLAPHDGLAAWTRYGAPAGVGARAAPS
jgi:hypothetical protein